MLRLTLTLISISAHYNIFLLTNAGDCFIDVKRYNPEPVIVSTEKYEFLYPPVNETKIVIPYNKHIIIACPGRKLTIGGSMQEATCLGKTKFKIAGTKIILPDKLCSKHAYHHARYTGKSCGLNGREVEIGFKLEPMRFSRLILICFDCYLQTSLYASYKMTKAILNRKDIRSNQGFEFIIGRSIYNLTDVRLLYSKLNQRMMINRLVGLEDDSSKYLKDDSFLARGHLAGKGDFMYLYQQKATYYYMNAAPQWDVLNRFNWQNVEDDIRDYAITRGVDLDIYSGIYGISSLPHEVTRKPIDLYLYVDEATGKKALPIPDIFWKVIYNPKTKEGVAFILHNNLLDENVAQRYICNDVSVQVTWLRLHNNIFTLGHGYACTVENFRQIVTYMPEIEVNSLMK